MGDLGQQEFQAVILAMAMPEFPEEFPLDLPKALLPVGNYPLVGYQLKLLDTYGFKAVTIVCTTSSHDQIAVSVDKLRNAEYFSPSMEVKYIDLPGSAGTADALLACESHLSRDFFVFGCDVITNVPLSEMANMHRRMGTTCTMLLHPVEAQKADKSSKIDRNTSASSLLDIEATISVSATDNRVVDVSVRSGDGASWTVNSHVMKLFPRMKLYTNLLDAHVYLFSRCVLDILRQNRGTVTDVKEDLIPLLLKEQKKCLADGCHRHSTVKRSASSVSLVRSRSNLDASDEDLADLEPKKSECGTDGKSSFLWTRALGISSTADARASTGISCHAYIPSADSVYCLRVLAKDVYMAANKEITRNVCPFYGAPYAVTNKKAGQNPSGVVQFSKNDCRSGDSLHAGVNVSVKSSVLGSHCRIGERVKIQNSIIMDHVTIDSDVRINDSIIFPSAHIQDGVTLKDVVVGSRMSVEPKSAIENEVLVKGETDVENMIDVDFA